MRIRSVFVLEGRQRIAVVLGLVLFGLLIATIGLYADFKGYALLNMACSIVLGLVLAYLFAVTVIEGEMMALIFPSEAAKAAAKVIRRAQRKSK